LGDSSVAALPQNDKTKESKETSHEKNHVVIAYQSCCAVGINLVRIKKGIREAIWVLHL
jgi:hypothetical protein